MKNKKGIIHFIPLILVTGLIIVVMGGIFYFSQNSDRPLLSKETPRPVSDTTQAEKFNEWIIYENKENGFSFEHPNSWEVFEFSKETENFMIAPKENVEVVRESINKFGYVEPGKGLVYTFSLADDYDPNRDDNTKVTLLSIDGRQAFLYEITLQETSPLGDKGEVLRKVVIPIGSKLLIIDVLDERYGEVFDHILNSFKISYSAKNVTEKKEYISKDYGFKVSVPVNFISEEPEKESTTVINDRKFFKPASPLILLNFNRDYAPGTEIVSIEYFSLTISEREGSLDENIEKSGANMGLF